MSVYFIAELISSTVKIGMSSNPGKRLNDLQTANSGCLRLMGVIPGDLEEEADLHSRFGLHRVRGEWFYLDPIEGEISELIQECGDSLKGWVECRHTRMLIHLLRSRGPTTFSASNGESKRIENMAWWLWKSCGDESLDRAYEAVEQFAVAVFPDDVPSIMYGLDKRFDGIGSWYA